MNDRLVTAMVVVVTLLFVAGVVASVGWTIDCTDRGGVVVRTVWGGYECVEKKR